MESTLTTSPSSSRASSRARSDLPVAVAPTTATTVPGPTAGSAPARHAQQDRGRRLVAGGPRGRRLAGFPRVAGPGAAHVQRPGVGDQVVRRSAGDGGGDDVTGPWGRLVRREVDQAVVTGAAGQPARGSVLAALALGDEDLDRRAVELGVLLSADLLHEGDQPVVALLDELVRHLAGHRRG